MFSFKEIVDEFRVGDSVGKIPFLFLVFSDTSVTSFPRDISLPLHSKHRLCYIKMYTSLTWSHRPTIKLTHRVFSALLYRNGESRPSCSKILFVKGTVKPKGTQMTVAYNSFCRVKQLGVLSYLHGGILVPFLCPYSVFASENMSKGCCFNETNRSYGRHTNISLIVRAQLFKRWITPTTG